jgi:hypothetical protein
MEETGVPGGTTDLLRKHFPPPDLPRHYKPVHVFQKPTDCDVITKQKEQTAVTRGLALGEVGKYILLKSEMFLTYQNTKIATDRWFLRVLQFPPSMKPNINKPLQITSIIPKHK